MSAKARGGGDALAWAELSLTPWKQEPATVKTEDSLHDKKREERNARYDGTMACHCIVQH